MVHPTARHIKSMKSIDKIPSCADNSLSLSRCFVAF
jgi:hypothetical protein